MYKRKLLFAACCSIFLNSGFVMAASLSSFTHTHHTQQLKPIPHSFLVAASTFLPEWVDRLSVYSSPTDIDFSDISDQNRLFTNCVLKGFNRTSCLDNQTPADFCPDSPAYFKTCLSAAQVCLSAGYVLNCPTGYLKDASKLCPEDPNYGNCIINPCEGYEYSLSEATTPGYLPGEKCLSGDNEKYQRTEASCPGFNYDASNCGIGAQCQELGGMTCLSGTITKYSECNSCPAAACELPLLNLDTYYCEGALRCLIP